MSDLSAFNQKNKEDFDRYSEMLSQSLLDIAGNKSLKATVAELSRLTGIHRNTIRQRVWPLERLESIKETRRLEVLRQQVSKKNPVDPVVLLTEKLEAARVEVLHWFTQAKSAEDEARVNEEKYENMVGSRDTYKSLLADANKRLLDSQKEIDRLKQVISILEAAQAEKSA
jgi:chromosome segregation ATPase